MKKSLKSILHRKDNYMETKKNSLIINCSPVKNGATAEIVSIVSDSLSGSFNVKSICIDDYSLAFCRGCRACHKTAECVQHDDISSIIAEFENADIVICVSPSYWADIPGQFKAFIDRCTPWCNTHEPHSVLGGSRNGYAIAQRTGPGMKECERIIQSIEHFYGHMEIKACGHLGLCSIEYKEDVAPRKDEILDFCSRIINEN